jgi:hypothetical protein
MLQKGNSGKAGLGFKYAIVCPLTACDIIRLYCLPTDVLVLSIILGNFILASIQLLDVNKVMDFIKKINIIL